MICKYYLTLGSEVSDVNSPDCIEVSSMISNLSDVEVSHARVGLGGVVRKIGSSIDFVGDARDRLVALFTRDQLRSAAAFAVYCIENDWTFTKFFECPLDFSTFRYNGDTASCSCLDSSAAAVIKAKKSVKYELAVSDIKDAKPLSYDGMRILNDGTYNIIGSEIEGSPVTERMIRVGQWWWYPRLGLINSNLVNNSSIVLTDQEEAFQTEGTESGWGFPKPNVTGSYFAECVKDCTVTVDFSGFSIDQTNYLCFVLFKLSDYEFVPLTCGYSDMKPYGSRTSLESLKWTGSLKNGDKLILAVLNCRNTQWILKIMPNDGVCRWYDQSAPIDIDVFSPQKLLDGILSSMSSGGDRIYGAVKDTIVTYSEASSEYVEKVNARLTNTMLAASGSIRDIKSAKVNTSFSDFCKFMETVFGYVYSIETRHGAVPREEILAGTVGFRDFNDLPAVVSYEEKSCMYVQFSNAEGCFVGVRFEDGVNNYYKNFKGYEQYQTRLENNVFEVRQDMLFMGRHVIYRPVSQNGTTRLVEFVYENVSTEDFRGTQPFGQIEYEVQDGGVYTGEFNALNVTYVKASCAFVYSANDITYESFTNDGLYNTNGRARKDMLYERGGQLYCLIGDAFVRCSMAGESSPVNSYVVFRHRDELFTAGGTHNVKSISDFEYEVSDRIYSQVVIGYNKQEYDIGNNGMDEFNFNVTYSVDQKLTDSKFSLISPYRADSYGIESLAEKRGEDSTSTDSDGKIFAVFCSDDGSSYHPDRTLAITGVTTETMFNGQLSPMHCVEANERYIASFAPSLKFASTEGNSEAVIGDRRLTSDIVLENPIFGHGEITFSSDSYSIPQDWNGYKIEIEASGTTFRGYLRSLDLTASESEVLKYKLIESK